MKNAKYTDLMLDLEYLAEAEDAVITQVSAIPFDVHSGFFPGMEEDSPTVVFNMMPNIQDQLNQGRKIDEHTMIWWMNQAVTNAQMPVWADDDDGSVTHILGLLKQWGEEIGLDWDTVRVWGHVRCDQGKLRAIYRDLLGTIPPWGRRNVWNVQTVRQLAEGMASPEQITKLRQYHDMKTHDAVDDCVSTIYEMSLAWDIIHRRPNGR